MAQVAKLTRGWHDDMFKLLIHAEEVDDALVELIHVFQTVSLDKVYHALLNLVELTGLGLTTDPIEEVRVADWHLSILIRKFP